MHRYLIKGTHDTQSSIICCLQSDELVQGRADPWHWPQVLG